MHLEAIGWIRMQDWSLSRFPPSHATKEYYQTPSQLIADDNAPLYQSSAITKYLSDMHVSLWQCEAKYQHLKLLGTTPLASCEEIYESSPRLIRCPGNNVVVLCYVISHILLK